MNAMISISFVAFVLLLIALYFLLKAVWELRTGQSERGFLIKGMIGVGLIVLVFAGPYLYAFGFQLRAFHMITSPGIQTTS